MSNKKFYMVTRTTDELDANSRGNNLPNCPHLGLGNVVTGHLDSYGDLCLDVCDTNWVECDSFFELYPESNLVKEYIVQMPWAIRKTDLILCLTTGEIVQFDKIEWTDSPKCVNISRMHRDMYNSGSENYHRFRRKLEAPAQVPFVGDEISATKDTLQSEEPDLNLPIISLEEFRDNANRFDVMEAFYHLASVNVYARKYVDKVAEVMKAREEVSAANSQHEQAVAYVKKLESELEGWFE